MEKISLKDLMLVQVVILTLIASFFAANIGFAIFISLGVVHTLYTMIKNLKKNKYHFEPLTIELQANAVIACSPLIGIYWFFYEPRWYQKARNAHKEVSICSTLKAIGVILQNKDVIDADMIQYHIEQLRHLGADPKIILKATSLSHDAILQRDLGARNNFIDTMSIRTYCKNTKSFVASIANCKCLK